MFKAVLIGVMVVLTSAFGLVAWISLRPPPVQEQPQAEIQPTPPARVAILATTRAVTVGTLLKPGDIDTIELAASDVPAGARADTPATRAELVGAMARHAIQPLQPLLPGDVLRPTEGGFLAAVLAPGTRAVSVAVDAVSGTAGLIWPGDRVDMILTQTLEDQATPAGRRTFGETVLHDVRVIAVDQQMSRGVAPDSASLNNRAITLEVLPAAAERIAVAVRLGKIALSVRALAGEQELERPGFGPVPGIAQVSAVAARAPATTWGQDVSPALVQTPRPAGGRTVHVFQGAASDKEFKFE